MRIFVDESAWMSILDKKEEMHEPMMRQFQEALSEKDRVYTTNIIIGNVVSRISEEQGAAQANQVYQLIEDAWLGTYLHLLWIGRRTQRDAFRLFKKYPNLDLGLFDYANVVLMNRRNVRFIMTRKKGYSELGFKTVPEDK